MCAPTATLRGADEAVVLQGWAYGADLQGICVIDGQAEDKPGTVGQEQKQNGAQSRAHLGWLAITIGPILLTSVSKV